MANIDTLIAWIREEEQRRSMWAFMEQHGGGRGYHTGYMHALYDVLEVSEGGGQDERSKSSPGYAYLQGMPEARSHDGGTR